MGIDDGFVSFKFLLEDMKICNCTGLGFHPNQLYHRDGYPTSEHEFEDRSFHYKPDENIALYGIFDGEKGSEVAEFLTTELPGQILFGQLSETSTDSEIRDVLTQAFLIVESAYFKTIIDQRLAERLRILQIPEEDASLSQKLSPSDKSNLAQLTSKVISGSTAIVILIFYENIYVANVGNCRALLCQTDSAGLLEVLQLSVDHTLKNRDELKRLEELNLDINSLDSGKIVNLDITRCIGNYLVKGGYKEIDYLASAKSEPVIATPEIRHFPITESTRFFVIFSSGVHKALNEASSDSSESVNSKLAQMIVDEFGSQCSLGGVAQAVTDRIARLHQELPRVCRRDDMTLLIRNFNFPIRSASSLSSLHSRSPSYDDLNYINRSINTATTQSSQSVEFTKSGDTGSSDTNSSEPPFSPENEKSEKIEPYVDFTCYYEAIKENPHLQDALTAIFS